jgi:hypothetical protein
MLSRAVHSSPTSLNNLLFFDIIFFMINKTKKHIFFIISFNFIIYLLFPHVSYASSPIASDPVISRNIPAYTSDDCFGTKLASLANNSSYNDYWRSCNATPSAGTPVTLTYDISGVAAASRKNVVLAWYNDPVTGAYDHTLINVNAYNVPGDYTIQANAAAGGGSPPASGWVTLTTVTGNVYHSRQHSLNLTGYNWVRLSVTSSEGSVSNFDVAVNMDLHDVSNGIADDWIFYGDSITQQAFLHENTYGGTFSQAINSFNSSYFPIYESGGIGGFTSTNAVANISTWLNLFPGKFVTLNYGTNDANTQISASTFYSNMKTMVQDIINAGKIPIIPTIPWGCTANISSGVASLNAEITQLYSDFPQIIKGPDLYTFFNNHQSDISGDCIHPTDPAGYSDYMTQWINTMETAVYTVPTLTVSPSGGNVSSTQTVTLSASKTGTTIYYTTDGSTPTIASSVYASPLTVSSTETIKALGVDQAGNQSDIASNTYTFPTPTSTPTPTTTPQSTSTTTGMPSSSSSSGPSDPNVLSGWSKPIMAGPHHVGTVSFIQGAGNGKAFISNNAVHDDVNVSIQKAQISDLENTSSPIPFPWVQGFNTVSDIYNYSVISAFNGYPIPVFDKPVTVILPFNASLLPSGEKPSLAWYDTLANRWKVLPTTVINWQQREIAGTTTKFSYFAVVYPRKQAVLPKTATLGTTIAVQDISATLVPKTKPKLLDRSSKAGSSHLLSSKKKCFLFICW